MPDCGVARPGLRHAYVHVPFCARRCSYCDFSIAVRAITPVGEYVDALRSELGTYDTSTWDLDTLYFGGGTPSRLGGKGMQDAISVVRDVARIVPGAEITIEANPDDVTMANADAWRAAGVNRVSLGVQSFHHGVLEWMHRTHTGEQAERAVRVLRDAGIANVSVDLIFSVPEFLRRDWASDVHRALALEPDHVSLYGLTIEPRSPLGRWRERDEVAEAGDEVYEAEFLQAHAAMTAAGLEHYEVSNFGRPGRRSRHNSAYWTGVPYAGLGPSAHAFDGVARSWNVSAYRAWTDRLARAEPVVAGSETLAPENRATERVYLGLRTNQGLSATDAELEVARPWMEAGWADVRNGTIVLTPLGWLRLDALATSLTLAESR